MAEDLELSRKKCCFGSGGAMDEENPLTPIVQTAP
jgi:hypothetical protein